MPKCPKCGAVAQLFKCDACGDVRCDSMSSQAGEKRCSKVYGGNVMTGLPCKACKKGKYKKI